MSDSDDWMYDSDYDCKYKNEWGYPGAISKYCHTCRQSSIICASEGGSLSKVEILVEKGADPCVQDNAPIRYAAEFGHVDVVRFLLEKGADPAANNNYAIQAACFNGRTTIVNLLLEHGADISEDIDETLLDTVNMAQGRDTFPTVKILLEHGADPTADPTAMFPSDTHPRTAIQLAKNRCGARFNGRYDEILVLLEEQIIYIKYRKYFIIWVLKERGLDSFLIRQVLSHLY